MFQPGRAARKPGRKYNQITFSSCNHDSNSDNVQIILITTRLSSHLIPGPGSTSQTEGKAGDGNASSLQDRAPACLQFSLQRGVASVDVPQEEYTRKKKRQLGPPTHPEGKWKAPLAVENATNGGSEHGANSEQGLAQSDGLALVGLLHLQAGQGERCWRNGGLSDGGDDPHNEGDDKEGGAILKLVQPSRPQIAQGTHHGAGQQELTSAKPAHVAAHDRGEDEGGDEDAAEHDAGLGDGDPLGERLPRVEGGEDGHGHPGKEVGQADQSEVHHSSPPHLSLPLLITI